MKTVFPLLLLFPIMAGCAATGPAIRKSEIGNLELNVYGPEHAHVARADIYLDGLFIGNATPEMPVLYMRRGERMVRVVLPGYKPYKRKINILGDPNHQVLNVFLEPVAKERTQGKKRSRGARKIKTPPKNKQVQPN